MNETKNFTHAISKEGQVAKGDFTSKTGEIKEIPTSFGSIHISKGKEGIAIHGINVREGGKVGKESGSQTTKSGQGLGASGSQIPFRGSLAASKEVRPSDHKFADQIRPSPFVSTAAANLKPTKTPGVFGGGLVTSPDTLTPVSRSLGVGADPEFTKREGEFESIFQKGKQFVRIADWIKAPATTVSTLPGDVLVNIPIGSANTANSRLQLYLMMYAYLKLVKVRIWIETSCGDQQNGSFAGFIVADPDFALPGGEANLRIAATSEIRMAAKFSQNAYLDVEFDKSFYSTQNPSSGTLRPENVGRFFMISTCATTSIVTIGNLYMEAWYECMDPSLGQKPFGMSTVFDTVGKSYTLNSSYPFGTQVGFIPLTGSNLNVGYNGSNKAYSEFYPPPGAQYLMAGVVNGTSLTGQAVFAGQNCQILTSVIPLVSSSQYFFMALFAIKNGDPLQQFIRVSSGGSAVSSAYMCMAVTAQYQNLVSLTPVMSEIEKRLNMISNIVGLPPQQVSKHWLSALDETLRENQQQREVFQNPFVPLLPEPTGTCSDHSLTSVNKPSSLDDKEDKRKKLQELLSNLSK